MRRQRHFDIASATALREAAVIRNMMVDLNRTVCLLGCDIATEEERARISDRSNSAYPILARTPAARRDNLATQSPRLNNASRSKHPWSRRSRPSGRLHQSK